MAIFHRLLALAAAQQSWANEGTFSISKSHESLKCMIVATALVLDRPLALVELIPIDARRVSIFNIENLNTN